MQSVTVKAFICQANQQSLCPLRPPSGPNQSPGFFKPSKMMKVVQRRKRDNGFAVGCASWSLEAELQRELEAEMKQPQEEGEEERQRIGMGSFRHKCEEGKGLVDYLECLEREAIMGADVGKEPLDYNRRAQIFDRSSRVFQALRQHDDASVSSPQQSSK